VGNDAFDKLEAMHVLFWSLIGSFTKAADALGYQNSSIASARGKGGLEKIPRPPNPRLFHRSTRSITLTQDGETHTCLNAKHTGRN